MYRFLIILLGVALITSCTKDVPENEKKIARTINESDVRTAIENFTNNYNSGNLEAAAAFLSDDYKAIIPDSDEAINKENYIKEITLLNQQYPDGKWEVKIEEIVLGEDLAIATVLSSFMLPNPIENNMAPSYSERSLKILKKIKNDGWKIIRSSSVPTFTYEENNNQ